MRTPESDESSSEGSGSLADGFGTVVDSDDDDTNFGEGSGDGSPALQADSADELAGDGETQVFLDPRDSYTDTDLDLNGDGLVDALDLHTAVTDFFDVSIGDDPGNGEAAADGYEGPDDDGHVVDPVHDAPDDGGLFGIFGV